MLSCAHIIDIIHAPVLWYSQLMDQIKKNRFYFDSCLVIHQEEIAVSCSSSFVDVRI